MQTDFAAAATLITFHQVWRMEWLFKLVIMLFGIGGIRNNHLYRTTCSKKGCQIIWFLSYACVRTSWLFGNQTNKKIPFATGLTKCTGNGLVVPSLSHKREVAGLFRAGCTKTFLSPLLLSPHRLMSYFDVWHHLSTPKIRIAQNNIAATRQQLDPPKWRTTAHPQQSTGEERREATK
jgi:hypothetical protein